MKSPKLKLTAVVDDRPVKLAVELPAALHRNLIAYAEILNRSIWPAGSRWRSEPGWRLPQPVLTPATRLLEIMPQANSTLARRSNGLCKLPHRQQASQPAGCKSTSHKHEQNRHSTVMSKDDGKCLGVQE
jgi:hypothetical protein